MAAEFAPLLPSGREANFTWLDFQGEQATELEDFEVKLAAPTDCI